MATLAARANCQAVSIIVPCRNESRHIRRFLDSLLAQDLSGIGSEVLIADGMSTDGTRAIVAEYCRAHPAIRIIDNPGMIVSTGLNAAVRAARNPVIIRMDAHTEYARDYVRRCLEVLDATGADNVGGPPRVAPAGSRLRVFGAAYHSPFAVGGARSHDVDYEGYVDSVFYGCWPKSVLERVGLFDETLVRNQDDELNLRLVRSGGRIWQSPAIVCWYQPRTSVRALFLQQLQYGFWKVAVIRKHRVPASWRHLVPGAFVVANLVLCAASLSGGELARFSAEVWGVVAVSYALCALAAAIIAARRAWFALPFLPLLFAVYHVGYGAGFLAGLVYWPLRQVASPRVARLFTELTR